MQKGYVTIWNQPTDFPILGTVDDVKEGFKSVHIPFEIRKSELKNHVAFAVPLRHKQTAIDYVERKFGRNI